jgi:hypothetical protein
MTKKDTIMYYVYLHKRKGTNKIFYVGKGRKNRNGDRFDSTKSRNEWWQHVVEKDGGFDVEIYKDNLTELQAFDLEKQLIAQIGLNNLVNITDGGLGGDTLTNHPNIDKIGKKISEANKGSGNGNYGKGYYYWWVQKYGKEKADEMLKNKGITQSLKTKGISKKARPDILGKNNPAKLLENREKISTFAKNRIRTPVVCEICGFQTVNTHIKQHMKAKHNLK